MKKILWIETIPLILISVIIDIIELTGVGSLFTTIPSIILFFIVRGYLRIKGAKNEYLFWLSFFDFFPVLSVLPLKTAALITAVKFHNHEISKHAQAN